MFSNSFLNGVGSAEAKRLGWRCRTTCAGVGWRVAETRTFH